MIITSYVIFIFSLYGGMEEYKYFPPSSLEVCQETVGKLSAAASAGFNEPKAFLARCMPTFDR